MKSKILFVSFLICNALSLQAHAESLMFGKENQRLVVNNRIMAKVNDKAISVVDIMKKMDVLFYREFPQYTSSIQARHQFYKANWRHVLEELISKELVLADAEENKLAVSNGDVRQEMENLFGPNIIGNLDKIGMTYDEAQKIVLGDIIIRRMIYIRVNNKVIKKITPQVVRAAYDQFALDPANIQTDRWQYYVISIRDKDATRAAEAADLVYEMLNNQITLDQLSEKIKDNLSFVETQVNVSQEYDLEEKDISSAYKEILTQMMPHTHSKPIAQKSRSDKSNSVFRIFILQDLKKGGVPSFSEMEPEIKDQLLDQAVGEETEAYLKKLRKHFHVHEDYLQDATFEPFSLG